MSIYNMKADGDHWRITKFTPDLEVESSYLVSAEACDCPTGHRHTCRHRQMLPLFEAKRATRGQYFLDFDRKVWLPAIADVEFEAEAAPEGAQAGSQTRLVDDDDVEIIDPDAVMGNGLPHMAGMYAKDVSPTHAFTMLDLAKPEPPPIPKSDLRRI